MYICQKNVHFILYLCTFHFFDYIICKKFWQKINLAPLPDSYLSLYRANGLDELIGFVK